MTYVDEWPSHDAELGHCAQCGREIPYGTGGDGNVIAVVGRCEDCGGGTVWLVVPL